MSSRPIYRYGQNDRFTFDDEFPEDDGRFEIYSEIPDTLSEHRRILNVGENAGRREIERAFRHKAFNLHPGIIIISIDNFQQDNVNILVNMSNKLNLDKNVHLNEEEKLRREEALKICGIAKKVLLENLESENPI